jgi:hypothetical protein
MRELAFSMAHSWQVKSEYHGHCSAKSALMRVNYHTFFVKRICLFILTAFFRLFLTSISRLCISRYLFLLIPLRSNPEIKRFWWTIIFLSLKLIQTVSKFKNHYWEISIARGHNLVNVFTKIGYYSEIFLHMESIMCLLREIELNLD